MSRWKRLPAWLVIAICTSFAGKAGDLPRKGTPDTPVTRQLAAAMRALPGLDILLVTNEDPRARQIEKTQRFFQRHGLRVDDFDDKELVRLGDMQARASYLDEAAWPLDGSHGEPICVLTLNRADYRASGSRYWEAAWSIPAGRIDLKVDPVDVGNWDVNHELFHCLAHPLHLEHPPQIKPEQAQTLYDEAGADAYAALAQARQDGNLRFIEVIGSIRQVLTRADRTHYTKGVLDYIEQHPQQYNPATLKDLSPVQLAYLAHRIVVRQWPLLQASFELAKTPAARQVIAANGYRHLQLMATESRALWARDLIAKIYRWVRHPLA
jgi:hypothetical protein